jgi:predicted DNA repair protein MutK
MASGIFAILDDIASLMDDVAMSSKIATEKTAGILGDDLAVNAEKATGFVSSRELPVLWAITKGSFLNKLIIIPIALALNYFFPIAIKVILVCGGLFLAFEGVEKIIEYLFHRKEKVTENQIGVVEDTGLEAEKVKVKSAITTDFILSIEIVIMALGTVLDKSIGTQILTVTFVAFLATVGVYGIVALIVRMDDAGFNLLKRSNNKGFLSSLGNFLIKALPVVIRLLGVVGTIALIMVSGGILVHNIDFLHHLLPQVPSIIKEITSGLIAGILVVFVVKMFGKVFSSFKKE